MVEFNVPTNAYTMVYVKDFRKVHPQLKSSKKVHEMILEDRLTKLRKIYNTLGVSIEHFARLIAHMKALRTIDTACGHSRSKTHSDNTFPTVHGAFQEK